MKNYKIETNGLNEAILHKAVEEGYDDMTNDRPRLLAKWLFLYTDGSIEWCGLHDTFTHDEHPEISAHDFLRLNWTPKVGDRVNKTAFYLYGDRRECGTIISINAQGYCMIGFDSDKDNKDTYGHTGLWIDQMIPVYPKKNPLRFKTEQEFIEEFGEGWRSINPIWQLYWKKDMDVLLGKQYQKKIKAEYDILEEMLTDKPLPESLGKKIRPVPLDEPNEKPEDHRPDAYIIGGDGGVFASIVARINNEDEQRMCDLDLLTSMYRIVSKATYKAKYPDKLMFKNWEVTVGDKAIDVGCKTYLKETLKQYLFVVDELVAQGISWREAYEFLNDNKKTLDL